jgi:hypothetical protein
MLRIKNSAIFAHSICVPYDSQNKQKFISSNRISRLVHILMTQSDSFVVENETLKIYYIKFSFQC